VYQIWFITFQFFGKWKVGASYNLCTSEIKPEGSKRKMPESYEAHPVTSLERLADIAQLAL